VTGAQEVVVERASFRHIDSVIELRALLLEDSTQSYACTSPQERMLWRTAYGKWLSETLHSSLDVCLLVAVKGHQVVGCVTGFIDRRAPGPDCLNGWCGWVQSMVVAPPLRGQGISRALMQSLMKWFEARDVGKVVLQSTPSAEHLYEGLGYCRSSEPVLTWQVREHCA